MDKKFWLQRWQQGQIGFHQPEVNDYLVSYWPCLSLPETSTVFVPLCGKSLDMLWLRSQGAHVVAIELSEQACRDFFAENNLEFELAATEHFLVFKSDGISLYCGDFFQLSAGDLADVDAVYDRAAMIAMPNSMRGAYVQHMQAILPVGASILLVAMEYAQNQMDGPPFAVFKDEVVASYAAKYRIEEVLRQDVLAENPRFQERGLSKLVEAVYVIQPR